MLRIFLLLILCLNAFSFSNPACADETSIDLITGLKYLNHPVTTKNKEAQEFFNQGLTLIYAYNIDGAYRSFYQAAKKDPNMAMAYWGIALSLSLMPAHIVTDEKNKMMMAYKKAQELAPNASENEQDYINALAERFSNDPKMSHHQLAQNYREAMKKVMEKYPDDLDAATLYVELSMEQENHAFYTKDKQPKPGTLDLIEILENVMQRDPLHPGANHFYIHTVEGSKHSERAAASATRVLNLLPDSGHFLHVAAHIFLNTGDYLQAAEANDRALKADLAYYETYGKDNLFIVPEILHCYDYAIEGYIFAGRFEDANNKAQELKKFYLPLYSKLPKEEYYLIDCSHVLWRFHKWEDMINQKNYQQNMYVANAFLHFTKSLGNASLGNMNAALQQKDLFVTNAKQVPGSYMIGSIDPKTFFTVCQNIMDAKIAKSNGHREQAIQFLVEAMQNQGDEPIDWYFPIYVMLGAEYLIENQPKKAEYYFRQDLARNYRNPRALFGLYKSLRAQKRDIEALWVEDVFKKSWKDSTTTLTIEDIAL